MKNTFYIVLQGRRKISTPHAFNCKNSVSQKIPNVRLLSSFASQNTLATFLGLFHQFSNDIVLLSQFLMRHIEETDRSLTAFLAGDARYMILTKQLFLRRSLFVHQYYFSYN